MATLKPEDFKGFAREAIELAPGSSKWISITQPVQTGPFETGESRAILEGVLYKNLAGDVRFQGDIFGQAEPYNFNRPGLWNEIGKRLPGRSFTVEFVGRVPIIYPNR